ncbi:MAG: hypothetical protein ACLGH0_15925, partial [Thermoanaerobaculia bacterium]
MNRVRLIDAPEENRTTATLAASLVARWSLLAATSGATGAASFLGGLAALGREVSGTADGARVRHALARHRAGANGKRLWDLLRMCEWTRVAPPAPVLDQLRNDVALLLAADLEDALALMPMPSLAAPQPEGSEEEEATFLDAAVGAWAFCRELANT